MTYSITASRHERQMKELPCYADLYYFLTSIRQYSHLTPTKRHIDILFQLLEQAGKIATGSIDETEEAINEIERLLR